MEVISNAVGGLALFLLAMVMMTNGLKAFIGTELKTFLQKWTSSPVRGVFSGALVTGLVQSSSAVTVAIIGFVNAGVLTLQHALGVIFGANVGTTITGWLVSLVGFGLKIEAMAMPILAAGVGLRFIANEKRTQSLGEALVGFGLFFLGLAILKSSFSGVADSFGRGLLTSTGYGGLPGYILAGFVATVLTQSSSAAIAIILVAASESVMGINAAAAAIIGANIGTTSTAAFAAIHATPNAKRVAAGHVVFNLTSGLVALLILPGLLLVTSKFGHLAGFGSSTVAVLALFHTVFNVFGVLIMLPLTHKLARLLQKLYKTEEEELSRPQYLDKSVALTPALAISALWHEVLRLKNLVYSFVLVAIRDSHLTSHKLENRSKAIFSLSQAVDEFVTTIGMEDMTRDLSEELPKVIRTSRYLEEATELACHANELGKAIKIMKDSEAKESLVRFAHGMESTIVIFQNKKALEKDVFIALNEFQSSYQETKAALLRAAASRNLTPETADELLDKISRIRRMVEQLFKASQILGKYNLKNTKENQVS